MMLPDFTARLHAMAEIIVRIGLNLQPGQRIIATDPYTLHGVARSAEILVNALSSAAREVSDHADPIDVIWGDAPRVRALTEARDWRGLESLATRNAARLQQAITHGDAVLFLCGSHPRLMSGIAPAAVTEARQIGWRAFGPVAQQLVGGATNWTSVPVPSPGWAAAAFEFLPTEARLTALWTTVFQALRCQDDSTPPLLRWHEHLEKLAAKRDALNARRVTSVRFGELTVTLPPKHLWCTAQLRTRSGVDFVANLPTEEIFTAPDSTSAEGMARVAGPIHYAGEVISGIELEFSRGEVVTARAAVGHALLQQLLETDSGARRLGEVALVADLPNWSDNAPTFHHVLLDENAAPHVALGEAYPFCHQGPSTALNRSLIHVDLPLAAAPELR